MYDCLFDVDSDGLWNSVCLSCVIVDSGCVVGCCSMIGCGFVLV